MNDSKFFEKNESRADILKKNMIDYVKKLNDTDELIEIKEKFKLVVGDEEEDVLENKIG